MNFINKAWKRVQAYFTDANSEYRLERTPLPELYELKSAHQQLFQAYAEALATVSRLTFFVRISEIQHPPKGFLKVFFYKIASASISPLRLLIWRPIVNFYIQAHIYSKLKELDSTYTLASFLPSNGSFETNKLQDWLVEAKKDCQRLLDVVGVGKILRDAINLLALASINILIAAWGANDFFDLLLKMPINTPSAEVQLAIGEIGRFLLVAIPLTSLFITLAFQAKRVLFEKIYRDKQDEGTIYQLENTLFDLIGVSKTKEFPVDIFSGSLVYILPFFFLKGSFVLTIYPASSGPENSQVYDLSWVFQAIFLALFIIDVLPSLYKRLNSKDI